MGSEACGGEGEEPVVDIKYSAREHLGSGPFCSYQRLLIKMPTMKDRSLEKKCTEDFKSYIVFFSSVQQAEGSKHNLASPYDCILISCLSLTLSLEALLEYL